MKLISLEPQALRVKAKHLTGKGPLSDVGAGHLPVKKEAVTGQQSQGQKGSLSCHAVHTNSIGRLTQTSLHRENLNLFPFQLLSVLCSVRAVWVCLRCCPLWATALHLLFWRQAS